MGRVHRNWKYSSSERVVKPDFPNLYMVPSSDEQPTNRLVRHCLVVMVTSLEGVQGAGAGSGQLVLRARVHR